MKERDLYRQAGKCPALAKCLGILDRIDQFPMDLQEHYGRTAETQERLEKYINGKKPNQKHNEILVSSMKEFKPIHIENENGSFIVSESPTGEEVIGMIPKKKKPVYLDSGRIACTPEYERESIEFAKRYENERIK